MSDDYTAPASAPVTLASALLDAQRAVRAVEKDARNDFHKYAYASAESIITEARQCLLAAGLVVRRGGFAFTPGDPAMLTATFHVWHPASAEKIEETATWPVVPEKGRPWDKAVATALTSGWSYWLRDLLLIPRVAEEMDKRDDTGWTPPVAAAQTRPAAAPSRPNGGYGRDSGQARPGSTQAPAAAQRPTVAPVASPAAQARLFARLGQIGVEEIDRTATTRPDGSAVTWAEITKRCHDAARGGASIPGAILDAATGALDARDARLAAERQTTASARPPSGIRLGKKHEPIEEMSDESLDWWRGQLSSKLDDPRWGEKNRLDLVAVNAEIAYRQGGPTEIESGEVLPDEAGDIMAGEYGETDELLPF